MLVKEPDVKVYADGVVAPDYAQPVVIRDARGRPLSVSQNLRGIRRAVGREHVDSVVLYPDNYFLDDSYACCIIYFSNFNYCRFRFASYVTLCYVLREWRNLRGVPLYVDTQAVGEVGYYNEYLKRISGGR